MNPLSTWTFYRRHKRRAALLLGLICWLLTVTLLWFGGRTFQRGELAVRM